MTWADFPISEFVKALFLHPLFSLLLLVPSFPMLMSYGITGRGRMIGVYLWLFCASWLLHTLADASKMGF